MPLFINKVIRTKYHDNLISVRVVQVLVAGTNTYKNMVKIEGRLVPLEEYLRDQEVPINQSLDDEEFNEVIKLEELCEQITKG